MQAFERYRLKRAEKILNLLNKGREREILLQRNSSKMLNRLQKHQLIEVIHGRFQITKQGKVVTYLDTLEVKEEVIHFSLKHSGRKASFPLKFTCLMLLLFLSVLFFVLPHPYK